MLNNLSNIVANEIDIMTVDSLIQFGYAQDQAVKLVTEFEFDPLQFFAENPLTNESDTSF